MTDPIAAVAGRVIPSALTELGYWVLWDGREKTPMAPWVTGDMYRAGWGNGVVEDDTSRMTERPETDFETARQFAELGPEIIHETHPFPDASDLPERVIPAILLPHNPPKPPVMQVDFDDVRDPDTGAITPELQGILDRLSAFTEVSSSGAGIHAFVRAALPGQLGKFIAPLDDRGAIELYDHGRFVACTWDHVEDTPTDVPYRQDAIDELVAEYETPELQRRREAKPDDITERLAAVDQQGTNKNRSPYYDIDIRQVADRGQFAQFRKQSPGDEWTGPHPRHGPVKSKPRDCTNFGIDPKNNAWHCFAHGVGGGPLHLIAVLEGILPCSIADQLMDRPEELLRTCVAARDRYAHDLDDVAPPYAALVAIAEQHNLLMEDPDEGRLGKDCWRIARLVYGQLGGTDGTATAEAT